MKKPVSMPLAIASMVFCLALIPNSASAQEEKGKEVAAAEQKPVPAYRIEFNVREIENGKRLNSRNYLMVVENDSRGMVRVGNRVPYQSGQTSEKQVQFQEIRMNIDCHPRERGENVALAINLDFTSFPPLIEEGSGGPIVLRTESASVLRTESASVDPIVTLGKPTLVAGMDDVVTNRRYEIEVTATKVK